MNYSLKMFDARHLGFKADVFSRQEELQEAQAIREVGL
jgi:hypothetical protein